MASRSADGLYVALPTMATANAMFDRIADAHRHLFAAGASPSIALAHGARDMHEGFRAAMPRGGRGEAPYSDTGARDEAIRNDRIGRLRGVDRRRPAPGVPGRCRAPAPSIRRYCRCCRIGTSRCGSWASCARVLILDEVHAYDAYMQREMERLLEFQAGLGGSAILLSATLPLSVRERLTDAFAKGLGKDVQNTSASMEYPLATVCAAGAHSAEKVDGRTGRARRLPVRFLRSCEEALSEVETAARAGKQSSTFATRWMTRSKPMRP